jgi:acetyltransferase
VRALCNPDNEQAEFAIAVRSDLQGAGLGELLMRRLISYLRERRTQRVVGDVLRDNTRMLALARRLGFEVDITGSDGESVQAVLKLS